MPEGLIPGQAMESPTASVLDVRGLECPIPVLRASQQLRRMAPGEVLEVLATDPVAPLDFDAFTWRTGHRLILSEQREGTYRFLIERKSGPVPMESRERAASASQPPPDREGHETA
jgi:tRNA 2-thiouridine synthesizing protein A